MLERLRPVARRVAPLQWLYRRYRGVPAASGPEPQTAFPSKLNYGCGHNKLAGYLNVDIDPACQPDLLIKNGDTSAIPRDYFEEVLANDVLEHFPRTQTLSALLDWASWLKIGGTLLCETSSIFGAAEQLRRIASFEHQYNWTRCLFGNQVHDGDFHYTGFTELTLKGHLLAAELEVRDVELRDGWLFAVTAVKTKAWDGYVPSLAGQSDETFVRETFRHAVYEEPSAASLENYLRRLKSQPALRWQIAKEVFQSDHRLWATAMKHSL